MDKITDHVDQAAARLPDASQNPIEQGLVKIFASRVQGVESAAFDLLLLRSLETSEGAQLDGLGRIVGEPRSGRDDESYRLRIRARILVHKSSGAADELLRILRLVIPETLTVRLEEEFPAALSIQIANGTAPLPGELHRLLLEAKAAGVRLFLRYQEGEDAAQFCFAGGVGKGFDAKVPDAFGPLTPMDERMTAAPPELLAQILPDYPSSPFVSDYEITVQVHDSYFVDPPDNTFWIVELMVQLRSDWPFGLYYSISGTDPAYNSPASLTAGAAFDTPAGLYLQVDIAQAGATQNGIDVWSAEGIAAHVEPGGKLVGVKAG